MCFFGVWWLFGVTFLFLILVATRTRYRFELMLIELVLDVPYVGHCLLELGHKLVVTALFVFDVFKHVVALFTETVDGGGLVDDVRFKTLVVFLV